MRDNARGVEVMGTGGLSTPTPQPTSATDGVSVVPTEAAAAGERRQRPAWLTALLVLAVIAIGATVSEFIAESLVIGATENAPLVLAALGFALLYRLNGLLNVAFTETVTLGGYFAIWITSTTGWGFAASVIPAGILSGLLSVATYLLVFRPAKRRNVDGLELIVISFGLALFLRHALQFVFGFRARFFETPPPNTINVLGVGVPSFRLLAVASVAILAIAIYQFIRRTSYGLQIRALASNEGLAESSGVRRSTSHFSSGSSPDSQAGSLVPSTALPRR